MTVLNVSSPITVENITRLYLYGAVNTPEHLEDRLRPADVTNGYGTINTSAYMGNSGAGRYASPFQSEVVSDFFSGKLNLSQFADKNGNIDVSLAQIKATMGESNIHSNWSISHYTTDIGSADYEVRAYVFGTSGYDLPETTRFVVENGEMRVFGASPIPQSDNFDFQAGNGAAQKFNDYLLRDIVDPYNIGREVKIDFVDVETYVKANELNVITASDDNRSISVYANMSHPLTHDFYAAGENLSNLLINFTSLLSKIGEATEYYKFQDKNVVYGTNGDDSLDAQYAVDHQLAGISSLIGQYVPGALSYYDSSLPNIYIAGEGDDIIHLDKNFDVAYGGSGSDRIITEAAGTQIYGGSDNDFIYGSKYNEFIDGGDGKDYIESGGGGFEWSEFIFNEQGKFLDISSGDNIHGGDGDDTILLTSGGAEVHGGDGSDTLSYSKSDGLNGRVQADRFLDADQSDKIVFDTGAGSSSLDGGSQVFYSQEEVFHFPDNMTIEVAFVNADDQAVYLIEDLYSARDLHVTMVGGNQLIIENYGLGDAGIHASETSYTTVVNPDEVYAGAVGTSFIWGFDGPEYLGLGQINFQGNTIA